MVGPRADRPLVVLDLALPRDVDPAVAVSAGVTYVDLDALRSGGATVSDDEVDAATRDRRRRAGATTWPSSSGWPSRPTVTALRARANQVDRRRAGPAGRAGCPASTPATGARSPTPCAARSRRCCTRRPSG